MLLRALQDVPDWSVAAARSPLCALSALLPLSALRVRRLRGDQWITFTNHGTTTWINHQSGSWAPNMKKHTV